MWAVTEVSVTVTCTIKVEDSGYDSSSVGEIFTVFRHNASTGSFSSLPGAFIDNLIEGAAEHTKQQALDKVKLIKGDK